MQITKGKYYQYGHGKLIIKAIESTNRDYFIGVVVSSDLIGRQIGYHSKAWDSSSFTKIDYTEDTMERLQRFKVGDKVTYKSNKNETKKIDDSQGYYLGGKDQDGYVGTILGYVDFNSIKDCWEIDVTSTDSGSYVMLETDFLEYDEQPVINEFFPIY
jgi:hypothetical protein